MLFPRFDRIVRKVGPLLPLIPVSFRVLAQLWPTIKGTSHSFKCWWRTVLEPLLLYIGISVWRIIIYRAHLAVENSSLINKFPKTIREDGHVVSDHIVLGASMIAILQIEAILLFQEYKRRNNAFAGYQQLNNRSRLLSSKFAVVYTAILVLATLFALTTGDMFFTALHFHPQLQSSLAVGLGLVAFQLPSLFWVYYRI